MHELDFELSRLGVAADPTSQAARELAAAMVERMLLADKALESEFDRDPAVLLSLRSAKDQILADAYLARTLSDVPPPDVAQISDYYQANPELYSQRRGYHFLELIADQKVSRGDVSDAIGQGKGVTELGSWLQEREAVFATREVYASSESIGTAVLAALRQLQPSQLGFVDASEGVHVVQLIGMAELPLDLAAVKEQISEILHSQARQRATAAEVQRLKDLSKITWYGPFADNSGGNDVEREAAPEGQTQIHRGLEGLR